ncbi:MAG: alkyl sulfatase dimerization domain-containing protein [Pseudomonadales bacterium]|nr:alkyl sulfatase dimerization domain-containing protein [Pseudomonadales bacterium]
MNDFLTLAERAWQGQLDMMFEHHPVHAAYDGATEIVPGVLALKGIACIYIIDTGDGLLMLDAGSQLDTQRTFSEVRKWRPDAPLKLVVFSHHHVDHIFAVEPFIEEAKKRNWTVPKVIAHRLTPDHFDRYVKTNGWNTAINRRQFAIHAPNFHWPDKYHYPDITYDDTYQCRLGDLDVCLHHARGETDDHTWTYIPQHKLVMTGDLFIWALPNAGNPQKVQRYVSDWAAALRLMASLEAELLLPGHGFPIFGQERVQQALTDTANLLDSIEDQVLSGMNQGLTLDALYQQVELPAELMKKPYLQPIYDDAHFLIRMIWRRYGGWWDGEYDTLLPASKAEQATAWVDLAGGIDVVIARALSSLEQNPAIAAHLIETAFHAQPESAAVHAARASIYRARSAAQTASMARNIFNHAALSSDAGVRDLASTTHLPKG